MLLLGKLQDVDDDGGAPRSSNSASPFAACCSPTPNASILRRRWVAPTFANTTSAADTASAAASAVADANDSTAIGPFPVSLESTGAPISSVSAKNQSNSPSSSLLMFVVVMPLPLSLMPTPALASARLPAAAASVSGSPCRAPVSGPIHATGPRALAELALVTASVASARPLLPPSAASFEAHVEASVSGGGRQGPPGRPLG